MPQLTALSPDALREQHREIRARYDAFAARGVKLNLTRGKPAPEQLDLSAQLLDLPHANDFMAGNVDCRNYGELQGLPDLRAQLAPVFGVSAERVILGDKTVELR